MKTISTDLLAHVTGGFDGYVFRLPRPASAGGDLVWPAQAPKSQPSFGELVREGLGGISPLPLRNKPIPESGGIVGPKGSPTPF